MWLRESCTESIYPGTAGATWTSSRNNISGPSRTHISRFSCTARGAFCSCASVPAPHQDKRTSPLPLAGVVILGDSEQSPVTGTRSLPPEAALVTPPSLPRQIRPIHSFPQLYIAHRHDIRAVYIPPAHLLPSAPYHPALRPSLRLPLTFAPLSTKHTARRHGAQASTLCP